MLDFMQKINAWIQQQSPYQFNRNIKNSGDLVLWCLDQVKRPINGLYRSKKGEQLVRVSQIDVQLSIERQHLYVVVASIQGKTSLPFEQLLQDYQYVHQTQAAELTTADMS